MAGFWLEQYSSSSLLELNPAQGPPGMGVNMGTWKAGFNSCCAPVTIPHGSTTGQLGHVVPARDLPQSKDVSLSLPPHAWLPSREAKDATAGWSLIDGAGLAVTLPGSALRTRA